MNDTEVPRRTGFLDFLRNSQGTQFVIPVYQRNYTWTSGKEVSQYLEDVKAVLNKKYSNHFMGIIIYLSKDIDFSTREFSVIDGQQRLTTTFLTLYAVRYLFKELKEDDQVKNLDTLFLTNNTASAKIKYKLKPLVSDDNVYQCIVEDRIKEIDDKTSNVYKNFSYLKDEIKKLKPSDVELKDFLNTFLMALNKLYVVCVPILKDDNPQKIFESINATGVKLTASDLIRNYILMDLASEEQDKYYPLYWKKLEDSVSSDSKKLELFFRLYLASKKYTIPNKNNVYREFVEWYELKCKTINMTKKDLLEDIVKYAVAYNFIYKTEEKNISKTLLKSVKEFRHINSEVSAPLLMDFVIKQQNKIISEEQLNSIFFIINSYLIRRALCEKDTSALNRLFPMVLKNVLTACNNNFTDVVEYFKRELIQQNVGTSSAMPTDTYLKEYIYNSNMYYLRQTLRTVFDRLETENNPAPVDLSALSVEHLMPQTPTSDWLTTLNVDEENYQQNVHRLGNLTLATKSDNSKMSNNVWDYKNEILKNTSHIKMNEELLKIKQWNISEIDKRTKELSQRICELYPYPTVSDAVIPKMDIYLESKGKRVDAVYFLNNGNVVISAGAILSTVDNIELYPQVEDLRKELIEDGIIAEIEGELQTVSPYLCTSLSAAANFVLHGNRNGWDWWKDSTDGTPLKNNQELKDKMLKKDE